MPVGGHGFSMFSFHKASGGACQIFLPGIPSSSAWALVPHLISTQERGGNQALVTTGSKCLLQPPRARSGSRSRQGLTWFQVAKLTLSAALKAMMLYFLVVFLERTRRGTAQSIVHLTNPPWLSKPMDPQKPSGAPHLSGNRSKLSPLGAEEEQKETQRSGGTQDVGVMGNCALGMGEGRQGMLPGGKSWNWVLEDQEESPLGKRHSCPTECQAGRLHPPVYYCTYSFIPSVQNTGCPQRGLSSSPAPSPPVRRGNHSRCQAGLEAQEGVDPFSGEAGRAQGLT